MVLYAIGKQNLNHTFNINRININQPVIKCEMNVSEMANNYDVCRNIEDHNRNHNIYIYCIVIVIVLLSFEHSLRD